MAQSGSRYESLVSHLNQGVFVSTLDGTFIEANEVIVTIAGHNSVEEFLKTPASQLYADPADRKKMIAQLRSSGSVRNVTLRSIKKDGTLYWISLSAALENDSSGRPKSILGIVEDITDRMQMIEALRESEERYRRVVETSPDAIAVTSLGGEILTANQQFAAIFGYENVLELLQQPVNSIGQIVDADRPKMARHRDRMFSQDAVVRGVQAHAIRKDGTVFLGEFSARLLRNSRGEAEAFLTIVRDVTEKTQTEEALLASEAMLKEAQRLAHIGHYNFDIPGNHWTCSEELDRILGLDETCAHTMQDWVEILHPDNADDMQAYLRDEVIGKKLSFDKKYKILRPLTQESRWVHGLGNLNLDSAGKVIGMFGTISDITEAKEAEESHQRLEEQLRQSQKMEAIGLLAGGVAHDLNNMLTPVLGNADLLLLDRDLNSEQRRGLTDIVAAAQRAQDLVRQLMAFGRKQTLRMQALELNQIVGDLAPKLRDSLRKGIELELVLSSETSRVRADLSQIEQVIRDLVRNAQEAMPEGGKLTIRTMDASILHQGGSFQSELPAGRYAVLSLQDSGEGMNPTTTRRIFEPFFTTNKSVGTAGLGLAASYGIIRQHGGDIVVESEVGRGTEFRIYLPVSQTQSAPNSIYPTAQLALVRGSETILVAEDEEEVRRTTCFLLSHLGYEVLSGKDIKETIQIARLHGPRIRLLLTDVLMPEMSGIQLYHELKPEFPKLKVLFMSGYAKDIVAKEDTVDGAVSFIQKPYTLQALSQKVRGVLDA